MQQDATAPAAPAVEAEDVQVARGGRIALEVPRLTVGRGEVVALVGQNGSGKSTLLHAIAGLVPPRAGRLRVLGADPTRRLSGVGYVLQAQGVPPFLPATVEEVVMLARPRGLLGRATADDRRAVAQALERLDLADLRRRRLHELSGGQRQRALVAQGLAQEAALLLLDEPAAGLDLPSIERIASAMAEERDRGRTVIVATHDLGEAAAADRVVVLNTRVVAVGPPTDVLTPEVLREAFGARMLDIGTGLMVVDGGGHHHAEPGARSSGG